MQFYDQYRGHPFQDAFQANLGFVIAQTAHVEPGVYRYDYPDVDISPIIPIDTSANEWAKSVTYFSLDGAGRAGWVSGNANDVPTVNFAMEQFETAVYMGGIGYRYGFEEVNHARMLQINLDAEKAMLARRAFMEHVYEIGVNGDTEKGFEGLYNYTGVPSATVTADGTGSSTLWADKTPDQILRDVNDLLIGVHSATNTVAMADTLLLPVERFQTISSLRLTDTGNTVLEFLQRANVYTAMTGQSLTIRGMRGLTNPAAASPASARMIAYRRSPEVLKLHLPMSHRFLPVQVMGLQFVIPGVYRIGGLDVRLTKEVRYGDGI